MTIEIAIQNLADAIVKAAEISAASTEKLAAAYQGSMAAYAAGGNSVRVETAPDGAGEVAKAKAAAEKAGIEAALAKAKAAAAEDKKRTEAEAAKVAAELQAKADADLVGGEVEDAKVYDYNKDVAPLLTELLKKDKNALVALLAKFGAKNGQGLKTTDYAAVIAELSAG